MLRNQFKNSGTKQHFRMYKSGKQWVYQALIVGTLFTGTGAVITTQSGNVAAHADTTSTANTSAVNNTTQQVSQSENSTQAQPASSSATSVTSSAADNSTTSLTASSVSSSQSSNADNAVSSAASSDSNTVNASEHVDGINFNEKNINVYAETPAYDDNTHYGKLAEDNDKYAIFNYTEKDGTVVKNVIIKDNVDLNEDDINGKIGDYMIAANTEGSSTNFIWGNNDTFHGEAIDTSTTGTQVLTSYNYKGDTTLSNNLQSSIKSPAIVIATLQNKAYFVRGNISNFNFNMIYLRPSDDSSYDLYFYPSFVMSGDSATTFINDLNWATKHFTSINGLTKNNFTDNHVKYIPDLLTAYGYKNYVKYMDFSPFDTTDITNNSNNNSDNNRSSLQSIGITMSYFSLDKITLTEKTPIYSAVGQINGELMLTVPDYMWENTDTHEFLPSRTLFNGTPHPGTWEARKDITDYLNPDNDPGQDWAIFTRGKDNNNQGVIMGNSYGINDTIYLHNGYPVDSFHNSLTGQLDNSFNLFTPEGGDFSNYKHIVFTNDYYVSSDAINTFTASLSNSSPQNIEDIQGVNHIHILWPQGSGSTEDTIRGYILDSFFENFNSLKVADLSYITNFPKYYGISDSDMFTNATSIQELILPKGFHGTQVNATYEGQPLQQGIASDSNLSEHQWINLDNNQYLKTTNDLYAIADQSGHWINELSPLFTQAKQAIDHPQSSAQSSEITPANQASSSATSSAQSSATSSSTSQSSQASQSSASSESVSQSSSQASSSASQSHASSVASHASHSTSQVNKANKKAEQLKKEWKNEYANNNGSAQHVNTKTSSHDDKSSNKQRLPQTGDATRQATLATMGVGSIILAFIIFFVGAFLLPRKHNNKDDK